MTYEEMLEKIAEAQIYVQGYELKKSLKKKPERVVTGKEYIEVSWVAGGLTGGNCWGGNADTPVISEPPADLDELEKILEIVAPDISYLQFKKIDRKVVTGTRSGGYEYYGNYTEYAFKTLKLKDLYDVLVELKLI